MPDEMTPPAATPPAPTPPAIPQQEIDSGKTMAILCYLPVGPVGLIVSIVCMAQKNNAFSLYHAKQALTLYLCLVAAYIICIPLSFICIGIPLMIASGVAGLVFSILGIVNASGGQCKPLPLIAPLVERFFGKVQKA